MLSYFLRKEDVFKGLNISPEIKEKLMAEIKRRLTPQPVRIRAEFEITCFSYDGIDSIKEALKAGLKHNNNGFEIKVWQNVFIYIIFVVPSSCCTTLCWCYKHV